MATGKAKYDPLEAAKLGTDQPAAPEPPAFSMPEMAAPPPKPAPAAPPEVKPRPRYKVLLDKRISIRGQICDWKAGRIVDSAGYDIENLKMQGVELELIK